MMFECSILATIKTWSFSRCRYLQNRYIPILDKIWFELQTASCLLLRSIKSDMFAFSPKCRIFMKVSHIRCLYTSKGIFCNSCRLIRSSGNCHLSPSSVFGNLTPLSIWAGTRNGWERMGWTCLKIIACNWCFSISGMASGTVSRQRSHSHANIDPGCTD